jgi:sulfite reductase (ferredoxin)
VATGAFKLPETFKEYVLRINKQAPTEEFAIEYLEDSKRFAADVTAYRANHVESESEKVAVEK